MIKLVIKLIQLMHENNLDFKVYSFDGTEKFNITERQPCVAKMQSSSQECIPSRFLRNSVYYRKYYRDSKQRFFAK